MIKNRGIEDIGVRFSCKGILHVPAQVLQEDPMLEGPRILQNRAMTAVASRHTDRKVFVGQRGNARSIMYVHLPDVAGLDRGI
jgi:hypothetical protein